MRVTRLAAALLALLAAAACYSVQPRIVEPHKVVIDQGADLSRLMVYVRPVTPADRGYSVLFFPLRVKIDMADPNLIGREVMRSVWQTFLELGVFPAQAYEESELFHGPDQARRIAEQRGADLFVSGEVTHYLHGATRADTSLSMRLDIYDTASGRLLWSIAQAGRIEHVLDEDYILVKREMRYSEDPMQTLIRAVASNMAGEVIAWSGGLARFDKVGPAMSPEPRQAPSRELSEAPGAAGPAGVTALEGDPGEIGRVTLADPPPGLGLDVRFAPAESTILPESYPVLDELGRTMNRPEMASNRYILRGHTDASGPAAYNLGLSHARAAAVKKYLVETCGVDARRITVQGVGGAMPGPGGDRQVELVTLPAKG